MAGRGGRPPTSGGAQENKAAEEFSALGFSALKEKIALAKEVRLQLDIAVACRDQRAIIDHQRTLSGILATLLKYQYAQLKAMEVDVSGSLDVVRRTAEEVAVMSDAELIEYAQRVYAATVGAWHNN